VSRAASTWTVETISLFRWIPIAQPRLVPTEDLNFSGFLRRDMPALDTIAHPRFWKFVSTLEGKLAGFWQRGVRWVRLVEQGSATRSDRRKNDPKWHAVSTQAYDHTAPPLNTVQWD